MDGLMDNELGHMQKKTVAVQADAPVKHFPHKNE